MQSLTPRSINRSPSTDPDLLTRLRRLDICLEIGAADPFCDNTRHLSDALWQRGVANRLDVWPGEAHRARHWREMVQVYL